MCSERVPWLLRLIRAFHPRATEDWLHAKWCRPKVHLLDSEGQRRTLASTTHACATRTRAARTGEVTDSLALCHSQHVIVEPSCTPCCAVAGRRFRRDCGAAVCVSQAERLEVEVHYCKTRQETNKGRCCDSLHCTH